MIKYKLMSAEYTVLTQHVTGGNLNVKDLLGGVVDAYVMAVCHRARHVGLNTFDLIMSDHRIHMQGDSTLRKMQSNSIGDDYHAM